MKKVRWGIIGSGGIADRRTIPGLITCENAELINCMDKDGETASQVANKYSAKRSCNTVEELLADKEIDAVYIATPVFCHYEQAIAALKSGKHVLIEKPMSMNSNEAQLLLNSFIQNNQMIMVGYMMRYHNLHQQMKKIIEDGGIGQVVSISTQFSCWYPEIAGSWRQDVKKSGGGALMDLGVHCLDIMQYITNSKIKDVKSFYNTQTHNYTVEDNASVLMKLDNGAIGHMQVNFNVPDALPTRIEIKGTEGSLVADGTLGQIEGGKLSYIYSKQGQYSAKQDRPEIKITTFDADGNDVYAKQIKDFCSQIINKNYNYSFAQQSVDIQKICEKIYSDK